MSIFNELISDFPYYPGRKLGLRQDKVSPNLGSMVGKHTHFQAYYEALKKHADVNSRRLFVEELILFKVRDFMGTQFGKHDLKTMCSKFGSIELEVLEKYLAALYDADRDWGVLRKMMVNFGLGTPDQDVDLEGELERMNIPSCYENKINENAIKFYSPDRSLRHLAFSALSFAHHCYEVATAQQIQHIFLEKYYREMGVVVDVDSFEGDIIVRTGIEHDSAKLPLLPKLPKGWYYNEDFFEYVRNIMRGEHNLFKFEWQLVHTVRFAHHAEIVLRLDSCSNDILDDVYSLDKLLNIDSLEDEDQDVALYTIQGDAGEMIYSNFLDVSNFETEEENVFMRNWYEYEPQRAALTIVSCYSDDGTFDSNKMKSKINARFAHNKALFKKLKG